MRLAPKICSKVTHIALLVGLATYLQHIYVPARSAWEQKYLGVYLLRADCRSYGHGGDDDGSERDKEKETGSVLPQIWP